jgi:hypothetical protein
MNDYRVPPFILNDARSNTGVTRVVIMTMAMIAENIVLEIKPASTPNFATNKPTSPRETIPTPT